MAERYGSEYRKKGRLRRAASFLKGYMTPLPLLGGAIGSGALYWAGLAVGMLKELATETVPTIMNGGNYQQLLYQAFQSGHQLAAQLGLIGGIAGLLITRHGLDYIAKKIGWKK